MLDNRSRRMATPRHAATAARDSNAPVQRQIGDGGILNLGREAFHISGRRLKITGSTIFLGELHYTVEDSGGSSRLAGKTGSGHRMCKGTAGPVSAVRTSD